MATTEQFAVGYGGTPLRWNVFLPNAALYPPPWDIVCNWHGGGWGAGFKEWETSTSSTLAAAGIASVSCDYELTGEVNYMPGQTSPVRWPNQYEDARLAIQAARHPAPSSVLFGKLTGKVGAQGGSAGATLAMDTAILGTVNEDRADCVVALSANYDFSDQDSLDQYETQSNWLDLIYAYVNVPDRTYVAELYAASILPIVLAPATNLPAMFMVQSEEDPIGPPTSQMAQMVAALQSIGFANFSTAMVPGEGHAKDNWSVINPVTGNFISVDVINFFKASFLAGTGGGGGIQEGFRLSLTGGPYTIVGDLGGGILPIESRSAQITNLAPSTLYTGSLVHFSDAGESEATLTTFTSDPAIDRKPIPFGIYTLLNSTDGIFWTNFEDQPSLDYHYIKGFRGRTGITQLMPGTLWTYNFTHVDTVLSECLLHNKTLGLGVAVGIDATDEWYDTGGSDEVDKFPISLDDITPLTYQPVMWDPQHLAKMQRLTADLGAKYDSHPGIAYIVISGFMQSFPGFVSKTVEDDLKWTDVALAYGYPSKVEALFFAASTIIAYWMAAFPNTPLYWSNSRPFVDQEGLDVYGLISDFIIFGTNHRVGMMTTSLTAVLPPYLPPIVSNFPNGAQAISGSSNQEAFYRFGHEPDPYPPVPERMRDLIGSGLHQGRTFIETYTVDTNDALNADVIIEGNLAMEQIVPEF